jgi:hypothetical protein
MLPLANGPAQDNTCEFPAVCVYACSCKELRGFKNLRDKFKDPSSPFYLAPGEKGPESPDPVPSLVTEQASYESAAAEAKRELSRMGYDPAAFYEQKVVWGDLDSFQCVFQLSLEA